MELPAATFQAAHGVLQTSVVSPRDPSRDEVLVAALRGEFPNVINRSILPADAPPTTPHLILASTSSQLAISAFQADFEVRFYGDYVTDVGRGLEYVERKLRAVRDALEAVDLAPVMIGLIATLRISFKDLPGDGPAAHILQTHLRADVDADQVQDALARIALKVRDTYFLSMTVTNYESRILERPIFPGMAVQRVAPWEGRVDDFGIELALDINNALEARTNRKDPVVTAEAIDAVGGMLRVIASGRGLDYVATGRISTDAIVAGSQP